jgi:hypothetical protein
VGWQPETQPKGKPPVEKPKGAKKMKRLIDADALHKLFGAVTTDLLSKPELSKDFEHMVRAFIMTTEMIEDQPTIDAVPVIRCKDCKYWSTETEQTAVPNIHKCTWWRTIGTLPIDFCSRAERRGEHGKTD